MLELTKTVRGGEGVGLSVEISGEEEEVEIGVRNGFEVEEGET